MIAIPHLQAWKCLSNNLKQGKKIKVKRTPLQAQKSPVKGLKRVKKIKVKRTPLQAQKSPVKGLKRVKKTMQQRVVTLLLAQKEMAQTKVPHQRVTIQGQKSTMNS